jgi:hydrogenase nickel incorporation protein HypA/HybF
VALAARGDACPLCGSYQLQPTGGTELRVRELLVEDRGNP